MSRSFLAAITVLASLIARPTLGTPSVSFATVALSGEPAPGAGGAVFRQLDTEPSINNSGSVAFFAGLIGAGVTTDNNTGIWSDRSGALELVARRSDVGPPQRPALNDLGQTAFRAGRFYYSEGTGTLRRVIGTAEPAPGISGAFFSDLGIDPHPAFNSAGRIAFEGTLFGVGSTVTASNDEGYWSDRNGSLGLIVREGDPAPGAGGAVLLDLSNWAAFNDEGKIAFSGGLTGTSVTPDNRWGIWSEGGGSLRLVARAGVPAPGTAAEFSSFAPPTLNDSGQTAFFANLVGPGVTAENGEGIWSEATGSLQLVARTGEAAPGADGGVFTDLGGTFSPRINDAGEMAFRATISGATWAMGTDNAVFGPDGAGGITLFLREGESLPGLPGLVSGSFGSPELNEVGDLLVSVFLLDSMGESAGNCLLLAEDALHRITVIATGSEIEVRPGDTRTVLDIEFLGGFVAQFGFRDFNDAKQIAFSASFTDGTSGIFVATVPEPSAALLLCAGLLGLAVQRRRS